MVLVSVVIPIYNAGQYIKECLNSVTSQTLQDLEIICVDDGSTDDSRDIVKECQTADARIKLFVQENQGSGPARNNGLGAACGKYVAFLDADDFWHDELVLEKVVRAAEENASVVTGAFWGNYKDGKYERSGLHRQYFENDRSGRWIDFSEEQDCIAYWSYLYRREFLHNNAICFPDYYRFQDPPFLTKTLLKAERYYVVSVDWYCYRTVYKNALSTDQKTVDFMKGVHQVLELAQRHHLEKLTAEMIRQVNEFSQCIVKGIVRGNTEILDLLGRIQKLTAGRKEDLEPVVFLQEAVWERTEGIVDRFRRKLSDFNKLVIYGAGKYGHYLMGWIEKMDDDIEIIFAETKCVEERVVSGKKCVQIDRLAADMDGTLVIVAVTPDAQPQMETNLIRLGISNYIMLGRELMTALECMDFDWEGRR